MGNETTATVQPIQPAQDDKDRYETLKAEVDSLQVHILKANRPWHKDPSLWISISALVFSIGTTYFSSKRLDEEERKAARVELRGLLIRLTEIPRESTESWILNNKQDPVAAASIGSNFGQELSLVARQAAEVMARIPNDVTTTERLTVAYALFTAGLVETGQREMEAAEKSISDSTDWVAVYRGQGQMAMSEGKLDLGRQKYKKALDAFTMYPSANQQYIAMMHAQTYSMWAQSEWMQRQCDEAQVHLAETQKEVSKLVAGPLADAAARQLAQLHASMSASPCNK